MSGLDRTGRPHLRALTGLRFLAAFQVLLFHCTSWTSWTHHPLLRAVTGSGYVAVSLFFILSGFILTYVHGAREKALDRFEFYVNRFARIYPAYLFGLLLVAPFYFVHTLRHEGAGWLLASAVAVLTLVQAYVPAFALLWNPPAWSLSDEALFYALFPAIAPALVARRKGVAVGVAIGCYAVSIGIPLAYLALSPDGPTPPSPDARGFWLSVLRYGPFVRLPEFVIGIVLGRLYLDDGFRRASDASAALGSVAALVTIGVVLALSPQIPYPLLHNALLAPAFGALIVCLASGRGALAALLGTRLFVALGEASYSLYLIHVPLLIIWAKTVGRLTSRVLTSQAGQSASTLLFLTAAVAASLLTHKFIEIPMRDAVRRGLGRRRVQAVARA
jgi:peptidoglycan/LPS O-acetylase OafA/YrhL